MAERPRKISQEVSVQQIGAETLIYDGRRHLAFCLNASSASVWRIADGTRTIAQMCDAASAELGHEVSEELVRFTVETLRSEGLIEPPTEADNGIDAGCVISRRAMLRQLGVSGAMLLPVVASIVAPTAAQAYSGCVNCSTGNARAGRIKKLQQGGSSQQ